MKARIVHAYDNGDYYVLGPRPSGAHVVGDSCIVNMEQAAEMASGWNDVVRQMMELAATGKVSS